MDSSSVLIIGAGIAGCALGIALRRFGFASAICEAGSDPRDEGGGLVSIAPNGLRILQAMKLTSLVQRIGFPNDHLQFQDCEGRSLASVPAAGITVMRSALCRALRDTASKLGVRFQFGKILERIEENENDVSACFSDGMAISARMLVGADGVHSKTRESFFPQAPRASYSGVVHMGGVTRTDLSPTGNIMKMVFGHRAFFGYAVGHSGDTCWFSNVAQPDVSEVDITDRGMLAENLATLHREDPPEVTRILRAAGERIGIYPVYVLPSLPQWHRGGVCIIGDAAHAVGAHIGQGVSLALEDAFVLAKCLRNVADPVDAFALFGALRRNRVECIFEHSRSLGQQRAPTGWLGGKLPELILPRLLRKKVKEGESIYTYGLDWNESLRAAADISVQAS